MDIFRILVLLLMVSTAHANESKLFSNSPDFLTTAQSMAIIKLAAEGRKWTVTKIDAHKLRINLKHRDYKSSLDLTFKNQEIFYVDNTIIILEEGDDEDSEETFAVSKVPTGWLNNIKNDANVLFSAQSSSIVKGAKIFIYTPALLSISDSIDTLKYVAVKRKWTVAQDTENSLQLKLNHRGFAITLDFSFSGNEITYYDSSRQEIDAEEDLIANSKFKKAKVPPNWINNLKKDMSTVLPYIQRLKSRVEPKMTQSLAIQSNSLGGHTRLFYKAPMSASPQDSIDVLSFVSSIREWKVANLENDVVRISLNHNEYKAKLDFSIFGNEIRYTDHTEQYIDLDSRSETTKSDVPSNWLTVLKRDAIAAFPLIMQVKRRLEK